MKALMTRFLRAPAIYNISVPAPEPGELQIKVAYVSLNPTDCKYLLDIKLPTLEALMIIRQTCLHVTPPC